MKNVLRKINELNKIYKLLIIVGILLTVVIGVSYGYFELGLHAEQVTTIEVGIEEMEKFSFNSGETILINNDNITNTTNPKVTLTPGTDKILIQSTYDVYFQTVDNTFFYSTDSKSAELILTITDPAGNVITQADGLEYVTTATGVSGFDITEFWGFVPISIDYPISSQDKTNGTTQTWSATVTFVDLPEEQVVPVGTVREFEGVVIFKNGELQGLNEKIIEAGGGVEYIESKPAPTYASGEYIYTGLHAATDDYGTSYYFRGVNVDNNYVKFSGHLWEVVRINGNGSVRLLYAEDVSELKSSYSGADRDHGYFFGYTYTPNLAYGNEVDTPVKTTIDNWYENNLIYNDNYIVDTIYCNDKTNQYGNENYVGTVTLYSGWLAYKAYSRYVSSNPTLICAMTEDSYTVFDVVNGNGWLDYPIGMLTSDEIILSSNALEYTNVYMTMSPAGIRYDNQAGEQNMIIVNQPISYTGGWFYGSFNSVLEIRPVISIQGSSLVTGSGTVDDPYNVIGDIETPGA